MYRKMVFNLNCTHFYNVSVSGSVGDNNPTEKGKQMSRALEEATKYELEQQTEERKKERETKCEDRKEEEEAEEEEGKK